MPAGGPINQTTFQGACCAFLVPVALFAFLLLVIVIGGPGSDLDSASAITPGGGTSGGNLADADALTVDQIKTLLKDAGKRGKNLLPYAQQIHDSAHAYNINPLFSLGMFLHESSYATAGAGETCRNPGNISKRGDNYSKAGVVSKGNCDSVWGGNARWQGFATYGDGAQAQMWLLRVNYLDQGLTNLSRILNKYAPAADHNNPDAYAIFVEKYMSEHAGGK